MAEKAFSLVHPNQASIRGKKRPSSTDLNGRAKSGWRRGEERVPWVPWPLTDYTGRDKEWPAAPSLATEREFQLGQLASPSADSLFGWLKINLPATNLAANIFELDHHLQGWRGSQIVTCGALF